MIADPTSALAPLIAAGNGGDVALVDGDHCVTYAALDELVARRAAGLTLPRRSVVALTGETSLELVLHYLAIHRAGHVPLLAGPRADRLTDAWRPAAIVTATAGEARIERTGAEQPDLHPDLALLMSTSGSTGNPKLVRLSAGNLRSNATAIVEYLRLTPADRGITSLPLHYCYGLSVLHSHLAAGASVVLTPASVVDPCFAAALRNQSITNVAGVPHTFELVERAGAERLMAPVVRFLTVAGGRMAPEAVARWAERAEGWGVDFVVMYGQTEATARMAYLPPALARTCPAAIGRPIPGGSLRVDAPDGDVGGIGELVYRGGNVMMGYATEPADLALGATLDELRTGDLGRYDAHHDVFHVVGRRSRFVKPFGLRIDLDAVEQALRAELALDDVAVAGDDDGIAVAAPGASLAAVEQWVADHTSLPRSHVTVDCTQPVPRTPSGKVDQAAVLASARRHGTRSAQPQPSPAGGVAALFATVVGRRHVDSDDTFVSIGGDSLAYVECSIRLERLLGHLPTDWHLTRVGDLERDRRDATVGDTARARSRWAEIDTTVVLRAAAICTIVATHMRVLWFPGGAHLLLAIVGFNLSRFLLPVAEGRARLTAGLRTVARTAGPVLAWVAVGMVAFGAYSVPTLLLVNNYAGPGDHTRDLWDFWFVEVFVHLVVLVIALMSIPAVRRLDRRRPYGTALAFLAITLVFRYRIVEILDPSDLRFRTHGAACFFALGWLVHRSATVRQRIITSAAVAIVVAGFFGLPQRELFIIGGLVALTWRRHVPVPRPLVPAIGLLSSASLWILITHFTVWPVLVDLVGRTAAYPLTLAAGVGAWGLARTASTGGRAARDRWIARPTPITRNEATVRLA